MMMISKFLKYNAITNLLLFLPIFIVIFSIGGCGNNGGPPEQNLSVSPSPTPVVTLTPTPIPPLTYTNNWYHFSCDALYTGYNPLEKNINPGNVAQLEEKWVLGRRDGLFVTIYGAPAVYHGRMFLGYALNLVSVAARTGQFLWSFGKKGIEGCPVVSEDGLVFCFDGTSPSDLYAIDYNSGNQIWKSNTTFSIGLNNNSMVTVDESNSIVYAVEDDYWGPDDKKLYALSKQTGMVLWSIGASDNVSFKGNYVLLKNGKVFAAAHDLKNPSDNNEHMLQINPATQQIEAVFPKPSLGIYQTIDDFTVCNNILVVDYDLGLVAYDITTRSILWQNSHYSGKPSCNPMKNVVYVSGLVDLHPSLIAVDAATGEEIWHNNNSGYNPTIANGIVYFLTEDGYMIALNENTGVQLFSYQLGGGGGETTQVAINDGMLFFSLNGHELGDYAVLGLP